MKKKAITFTNYHGNRYKSTTTKYIPNFLSTLSNSKFIMYGKFKMFIVHFCDITEQNFSIKYL